MIVWIALLNWRAFYLLLYLLLACLCWLMFVAELVGMLYWFYCWVTYVVVCVACLVVPFICVFAFDVDCCVLFEFYLIVFVF